MINYQKLANPRCSKTVRRAKTLRKEAPLAERLFWNALREAAKTSSLRFRRQHPVPPYFVDFICVKARFIIEIDGPSHDVRTRHDQKRDTFLKASGYKVVRFTNDEVCNNLENTVEITLSLAHKRISSLYAPLP